MIRAYRPERPSLWRDVRAIPFAPKQGFPMLLPFVAVGVAMIGSAGL